VVPSLLIINSHQGVINLSEYELYFLVLIIISFPLIIFGYWNAKFEERKLVYNRMNLYNKKILESCKFIFVDVRNSTKSVAIFVFNREITGEELLSDEIARNVLEV
jgi:hypothetical protein